MKNISRQVIFLGFVSLFTDIGSEMLYPVTPIFLTSVLGAGMYIVGIIEGAAEVTAGFLKGYFGFLSDKTGRRSIFVTLGYSISALSKPLPGLFPSIPVVLSARITDRIGKGVRTAPRDALLASYAGGRTGSVFGLHRSMDTIGAAAGPALALLLLYFYPENYTLLFLIAFFPSIIAVGLTIPVKDKPVENKQRAKKDYKTFWKTAPAEYKFILVIISIFSLANSSDVFLILKSNAVSNSAVLAIAGYILYNVVYAISSYPLGRISDRFSKKLVFTIGLIIFSAVYLGFGLIENQNIIWVLFALYGIYAAATEGISKAWVSDIIHDENRGTAIGLLSMMSSLSIMLGSVIAGVLWDIAGSAMPFIVSSVISVCLAGVVMFKD